MDRYEVIAKGLKREGLLATWVAILLVAFLFVAILSASRPGSITDWSIVRSWAFFVIGLFAYGHLARRVAQLADAISQPK
jgi:uncharacterized membrane protein YphA (DoxX/SURF4 family)